MAGGRDDAFVHFCLARAHQKQRRYDEAESEFSLALARDDEPAFRRARGYARLVQGDATSAVHDFDLVIAASPADGFTFYLRALGDSPRDATPKPAPIATRRWRWRRTTPPPWLSAHSSAFERTISRPRPATATASRRRPPAARIRWAAGRAAPRPRPVRRRAVKPATGRGRRRAVACVTWIGLAPRRPPRRGAGRVPAGGGSEPAVSQAAGARQSRLRAAPAPGPGVPRRHPVGGRHHPLIAGPARRPSAGVIRPDAWVNAVSTRSETRALGDSQRHRGDHRRLRTV